MKSVLMSINPKWCELIAQGKKTIEVRKTKPKIDVPFKCYIYCTKDKNGWFNFERKTRLDGKVIGEFVCDSICKFNIAGLDWWKMKDHLLNISCLNEKELIDYIGNKIGYAWHISSLVIYDKPKELGKFFKPCGDCDKKGTIRCTEEATPCRATKIAKPPQSWCYVEELGV